MCSRLRHPDKQKEGEEPWKVFYDMEGLPPLCLHSRPPSWSPFDKSSREEEISSLSFGCVHGCSVSLVVSYSLQPHVLQPARLLYPWAFSRQEPWSGLPCPPPGALPDPGIGLISLVSPALAVGSLPLVPPGKPLLWQQFIPTCLFLSPTLLPCIPASVTMTQSQLIVGSSLILMCP